MGCIIADKKKKKKQLCIYGLNSTEINAREYREAFRNGQSMETGNIGYTRHRTKTNKAKHTTQYVLDITIHKTKTNKTKTQHNMPWTPLYASKHK